MLRSVEYIKYITSDEKNDKYKYEIIDHDFVASVVVVWPIGQGMSMLTGMAIAVAKEYAKRNLSVGKNIAVLCLHLEERGWGMENIIYNQDKDCSQHIYNWAEIAAERDRTLDKFSAMK